jgi:hypothetical protein
MEKYYELSLDLHTVSLFSIKLISFGYKDIDPEMNWYREFRNTLNKLKQYEERIKYDREVTSKLESVLNTAPNFNVNNIMSSTSGSSRQAMTILPKDMKSTQIFDL